MDFFCMHNRYHTTTKRDGCTSKVKWIRYVLNNALLIIVYLNVKSDIFDFVVKYTLAIKLMCVCIYRHGRRGILYYKMENWFTTRIERRYVYLGTIPLYICVSYADWSTSGYHWFGWCHCGKKWWQERTRIWHKRKPVTPSLCVFPNSCHAYVPLLCRAK